MTEETALWLLFNVPLSLWVGYLGGKFQERIAWNELIRAGKLPKPLLGSYTASQKQNKK